MRKYVAPTSEEHSQLGKAIENIEKTLQELNSNIPQTAIEDTKKVLQIADSIEGEEVRRCEECKRYHLCD
jgi:hypothetical protein